MMKKTQVKKKRKVCKTVKDSRTGRTTVQCTYPSTKGKKPKIGKLKKQKTKDIKVSRGVTMNIPLGGGRSLVGLDLSGHKKTR